MTSESENGTPQFVDEVSDSNIFPESFTSSLGDTIREVLQKHGRLPSDTQGAVVEVVDAVPTNKVEHSQTVEHDDTDITQRLRRVATRTGQVPLTDIKKYIEKTESNDKPKNTSRFRLRKRNLNSK